MWIHSLELKNFKSYAQARFSLPEPTAGKNLVLIGAQNGHGKTTLLEAMYLVLYDDDAINYLKRAGLQFEDLKYKKLLNDALHSEALPTTHGLYRMEIQIEIRYRVQGQMQGLNIRRQWFFDHTRSLRDQDKTVYAYKTIEGRNEQIDPEDLKTYINDHIVPSEYAPYFFFDGEKIVNHAQHTGAGSWLNTALTGLLGITLLTQVRNSLEEWRRTLITESAAQKLEQDLDAQTSQLDQAKIHLDAAKEKWERLENNRKEKSELRDSLQERLGGGSISSIKSRGELIN